MTAKIKNKTITMLVTLAVITAIFGLGFILNSNPAHAVTFPDLPTREGVIIDDGGCFLDRTYPKDPLRVNITPTLKGFHEIIMEKEIFNCLFVDVEGTIFPIIQETTLIIQQFENKRGNPFGPMQIEVIDCYKDLEFMEFGVFCNPPYTPRVGIDPLDCRGDSEQIESFVDMDTASYNWEQFFAKKKVTTMTVIVEKEIMDCDIFGRIEPIIVEVFTIEEKINSKIKDQSKWVICEKDEFLFPTIIGCLASDSVIPS